MGSSFVGHADAVGLPEVAITVVAGILAARTIIIAIAPRAVDDDAVGVDLRGAPRLAVHRVLLRTLVVLDSVIAKRKHAVLFRFRVRFAFAPVQA